VIHDMYGVITGHCVNAILRSGANVIKLYTAVIYEFSYFARVFVPRKPFKDSIVLAGKEGAYLSETPFRCSNLG